MSNPEKLTLNFSILLREIQSWIGLMTAEARGSKMKKKSQSKEDVKPSLKIYITLLTQPPGFYARALPIFKNVCLLLTTPLKTLHLY